MCKLFKENQPSKIFVKGKEINANELRSYFEYKNGELYWILKTNRKVVIGQLFKTTINNAGYRICSFKGKTYIHHRLIFLFFNDYLPSQVDHIDGNPLNNRIENLRPANSYQNQANRKANKSNKSGYKNVNWDERSKSWEVKFMHQCRKMHFGYFKDIELAGLVAIEARNKYQKEYANHG